MKKIYLLTLLLTLLMISCTAPDEPVIEKTEIKKIKVMKSYRQNDIVYDITDDEQYIWCATDNGIVRTNKVTSEKSILFSDSIATKIVTAKNNTIWAIIEGFIYSKAPTSDTWVKLITPADFNSSTLDISLDSQNRLWALNNRKLYQYANTQWNTLDSTASVKAMTIDKDDNLWFCDIDSINKLKKYDGNSITAYQLPDTLKKFNITSIAVNNQFKVALGSYGRGLAIFDQQDWIIHSSPTSAMSSLPNFVSAIEASGDTFWFVNYYSSQIGKYSNNNISIYDGEITEFNQGSVYSIHKGLSNKIIFGTFNFLDNQNLLIYNNNTWQKYSCILYPLPSTINEMLTDKSGNVWLAGENGITKITNGNWQFFLPEDTVNHVSGLEDVNSMIEDAAGNIWFGTDGGVIRYDGSYFKYFTSFNSCLPYNQECRIGFNDSDQLSAISDNKLYVFNNNEWNAGAEFRNVNGTVTQICGDWIIANSYAYRYYYYYGQYQNYDLSNSPLSMIYQMDRDNSGNQWFVTVKDNQSYVYKLSGSFFYYDWHNMGFSNGGYGSDYRIKNDKMKGMSVYNNGCLSLQINNIDWQPFTINWSQFYHNSLIDLTWQSNKILWQTDGYRVFKAEVQE